MKSRNLYNKLIATCLLLVALLLFTAAQSTALEEPINVFAMSGLIGLSRGEAASLNFTNVDRQVREVRLYFLDITGNPLKSSMERVSPGQSVRLVLPHDEIRDTGQNRIPIRGVVVLGDPPGEADPPGPDLVISSLEVFDGDGQDLVRIVVARRKKREYLLPLPRRRGKVGSNSYPARRLACAA